MRTALFGLTAAAVLTLIITPIHAQQAATPKYVAPRTADGHPDMQGPWARRGVGLQEANAPSSPLGDFGATGQPYPTVASGSGKISGSGGYHTVD